MPTEPKNGNFFSQISGEDEDEEPQEPCETEKLNRKQRKKIDRVKNVDRKKEEQQRVEEAQRVAFQNEKQVPAASTPDCLNDGMIYEWAGSPNTTTTHSGVFILGSTARIQQLSELCNGLLKNRWNSPTAKNCLGVVARNCTVEGYQKEWNKTARLGKPVPREVRKSYLKSKLPSKEFEYYTSLEHIRTFSVPFGQTVTVEPMIEQSFIDWFKETNELIFGANEYWKGQLWGGHDDNLIKSKVIPTPKVTEVAASFAKAFPHLASKENSFLVGCEPRSISQIYSAMNYNTTKLSAIPEIHHLQSVCDPSVLGGRIEGKDTPLDTAKREMLEESCLVLDPLLDHNKQKELLGAEPWFRCGEGAYYVVFMGQTDLEEITHLSVQQQE